MSAGVMEHLVSMLSDLDGVSGVGVDIEEIDRFRRRMNPRIFSRAEREWCAATANPAECLAGRWCAKEAVVKALASKAQLGVWDIEILATDTGRPVARIPGELGEAGLTVEISIAHTAGMAVSVAVARASPT